MPAIAEHMSYPIDDPFKTDDPIDPDTPQTLQTPSPANLRHAYFISYLGLTCAVFALLVASARTLRTAGNRTLAPPR